MARKVKPPFEVSTSQGFCILDGEDQLVGNYAYPSLSEAQDHITRRRDNPPYRDTSTWRTAPCTYTISRKGYP